mmetsp:Transcript_10947/g.25658  ORF Transcript_10947/g.25658 Transcript_10947/m.25658 type:complete len:82 (-) Transcript_10947:178-423(-)
MEEQRRLLDELMGKSRNAAPAAPKPVEEKPAQTSADKNRVLRSYSPDPPAYQDREFDEGSIYSTEEAPGGKLNKIREVKKR